MWPLSCSLLCSPNSLTSRYLPLCLFSSELRRKPCLPTNLQHLGTHLPVKSLPVSLLPTQISDHSLCRGSKGSSWPQLIELLSFYSIAIQSPENPPFHISGWRRAILETLVMGKLSSHWLSPQGVRLSVNKLSEERDPKHCWERISFTPEMGTLFCLPRLSYHHRELWSSKRPSAFRGRRMERKKEQIISEEDTQQNEGVEELCLPVSSSKEGL